MAFRQLSFPLGEKPFAMALSGGFPGSSPGCCAFATYREVTTGLI
jgi:hypothetical protein